MFVVFNIAQDRGFRTGFSSQISRRVSGGNNRYTLCGHGCMDSAVTGIQGACGERFTVDLTEDLGNCQAAQKEEGGPRPRPVSAGEETLTVD